METSGLKLSISELFYKFFTRFSVENLCERRGCRTFDQGYSYDR